MEKKEKIICLTGPTGSGKTDIAISIAKEFNGEIISADSRQIFKDVQIVSNIPPGKKKKDAFIINDISHYMIDFVDPKYTYTLYEWLVDAKKHIKKILKNKKTPIIAGGTPLYIWALVDGYDIESKKRHEPEYDSLLLYVDIPRDVLYKKINDRVLDMMNEGALEEARKYLKKYGDEHDGTSKTAQGYKHLFSYIKGELSLEKAIYEMQKDTRHYAKRQETWWRHHGNPIKISSYEDARSLVSKFLGKK